MSAFGINKNLSYSIRKGSLGGFEIMDDTYGVCVDAAPTMERAKKLKSDWEKNGYHIVRR